jgi:hypothetical protein
MYVVLNENYNPRYLTLILGVKMTMTPGRKLLEDGLGI